MKKSTKGRNGTNRIGDLVNGDKPENEKTNETEKASVEEGGDDETHDKPSDDEEAVETEGSQAPVDRSIVIDDSDEVEDSKAAVKLKKAVDLARKNLATKVAEVLVGFKHGTAAVYPNTGGRSIMMQDKERKTRGVNYELDAIVQVSHSISIDKLTITTNNQVLTDDRGHGHEATHMLYNYIASACMYRHAVFDVNKAMERALKVYQDLHGTTDPIGAASLVADWLESRIADWFASGPRGNKNTARDGVLPSTVLLTFSHLLAPNLMSAFERAVEAEGKLSISEVGSVKLMKAWSRAESALGKIATKKLKQHGVNYEPRVVVYSASEFADELIQSGGLEGHQVSDIGEIVESGVKWMQETHGAGGDHPLPRFIAIHMLKLCAPGNPNADSTKRPKHTGVGGTTRMLWTSQAENAGAKAESLRRGDELYAIRTTALVQEILNRLGSDGKTDEAREITGQVVQQAWGPVKAIVNPLNDDWRTINGYFPASDEFGRMSDRLKANWSMLLPTAVECVSQVKAAMDEYMVNVARDGAEKKSKK